MKRDNSFNNIWEDSFYDPDLFDAGAGDAASNAIESIYNKLIGEPLTTIIEFGCGTGRMLVKLACKGHYVIGIDKSLQMINRCKKKLDSCAEILNVKLLIGDASKVVVSKKASIAIAVDDFLTHFLYDKDIEAFFKNVNRSIVKSGVFITDLRVRSKNKIDAAKKVYPKEMMTFGIVNNIFTENGTRSVSMRFWEDYDEKSNILTTNQIFDYIKENGKVEKSVYKRLRQRIITKDEMISIARGNEFVVRQFIPLDEKTDINAGIYVFQKTN